AKMTDVPGHCRGIVRPLSESGVTFLNIGVNAASTPPDVPPLFRWQEPGGASIVMMYHRLAYGGVVRIPGSDIAVAVEVADDNYGPHKPEEIAAIYADLRQQFPGATIQAASLTDIANAVEPHKAGLPVLTKEIGDTWIHGIASDPVKLARFREVQRLRSEWIRQGKLQAGDKTDLAFLSQFSLAAEHTWGTDTKTWLDFEHYTPDALATMLQQPKYRTVTNSWVEKRTDIDNAIGALPAALRTEARQRVAALKPVRPATAGMQAHDTALVIETTHFTLGLDPATGAITRLHSKSGARDWASPQHPLAAFTYQTFSKQDYDRFLASYITVQTDWAPKDFGKPGIEKFGALSQTWQTKLVRCWVREDERQHGIVAQLAIENGGQPMPSVAAWPADVYLTLTLPKAEPVVRMELAWFGKRANRMPEAMWLTFNPNVEPDADWELNKTGGAISPFAVVPGGNRRMHAVSDGLACKDGRGKLRIEALDAPLVVLGEKTPIFFTKAQPDLSGGVHFNLFNNGWGTNYVQWFGEDMRFRFSLLPG
ncbi:MAG TPA: DUF5054 domain-containing protein, partial [Bryobacteraceae bacterium]|nr:DUF5054 domain-containing protein [Bryobacteraceae bacterium]